MKSLAFGAGFALVVVAVVGVIFWWFTRPAPPKPWNASAITAKFAGSSVQTGEQLDVTFDYTLENHTGRDYHLPGNDSLFKGLAAGRGLQRDSTLEWVNGGYVPSGQKINVSFHMTFDYNASYPYKEKENSEKLNAFIKRRLSEIEGFTVLDQADRYQINFPKPPLAKD